MKIAVLYFSICVLYTFASSDTKTSASCAAALRVLPNRSQFFRYESVSLSCEQHGNCSEWRVKRNTTRDTNEECLTSTNESHCFIGDLYPLDSGVYWCESAAGECSEAVNITVSAGPVILESPVLPVMEGDHVTLSCMTSSSNLTADFYKDGLLIGSSSAGNMSIHSVSKSDEGLYKCHIPGAGESLDSWMTVRFSADPDAPAVPVASVFRLICHVVTGIPYLMSTIVLALIYRDKRRAPQLVAEDRSYRVVMEVE